MFRSGTRLAALVYLQAARSGYPLAAASVRPQRRFIFTNEYLGIESFSQHNQTAKLGRLALIDDQKYKAKVREAFERDGLRSLFSEDLRNLLCTAEGAEDLRLAAQLLAKAAEGTEQRSIEKLPQLFGFFFAICKRDGHLEIAKSMWENPALTVFRNNFRAIRLRYLCLLYEAGHYEEVLDAYKKVMREMNGGPDLLDEATVTMAALHRLGTDEAFQEARELMQQPYFSRRFTPSSKNASGGRASGLRSLYIFAYMAMIKGEYGLAFDTISDPRMVTRSNFLSSNIKLAILTRAGRLEEALHLVRREFLATKGPHSGPVKKIAFQVIQELATRIKEEDKTDSPMAMELARVCQDLDKRAVLCEKTLEDDVLEPIGYSSLRLSRQLPPRLPERRRPRNGGVKCTNRTAESSMRPEWWSQVDDQNGGVK